MDWQAASLAPRTVPPVDCSPNRSRRERTRYAAAEAVRVQVGTDVLRTLLRVSESWRLRGRDCRRCDDRPTPVLAEPSPWAEHDGPPHDVTVRGLSGCATVGLVSATKINRAAEPTARACRTSINIRAHHGHVYPLMQGRALGGNAGRRFPSLIDS